MKKQYSHYLRTLKFWRAVEAFNFPGLNEPKRADGKHLVELKHQERLPWENPRFANSERGKKWIHTLYFGCIQKEYIMDIVRQNLSDNSEIFESPQALSGKTWMSALVVDDTGRPFDNTYTRAAFVYAVKALLENKNFDEINEWLKKAQKDYDTRFKVEDNVTQKKAQDEENGNVFELVDYEEEEEEEAIEDRNQSITWLQLVNELDDLEVNLPPHLAGEIKVICISEKVLRSVEPEAPYLNSFYTNDLNNLIDLVRNEKIIGQPLEKYLQKDSPGDKYDLQNSFILLQCIHPTNLSPARWPADPRYGLYSAQQAAVNLTLSNLTNQDDLLGINGPPGTGKTTLLREVIADIILQRAKRMSKYGINELFEKKPIKLGSSEYYNINAKVFGNDGILVASNNNTAVENISKELPQYKSIDIDTFPDADYMSHVAALVCGNEESWGMLSAVLGNAGNCNKFRKSFWEDSGFGDNLEDLSRTGNSSKYKVQFDATARDLKKLLDQFNEFREVAAAYHEGLLGQLYVAFESKKIKDSKLNSLKNRLLNEYEIPAMNIPDAQYAQMNIEDIHGLTPYSSPLINKLRSDIFLKALDLHLYAILVNATYFSANLGLFLDMLIGKNSQLITEVEAPVLWHSFFFCVPVISSSLASIERFMRKLGRKSIGWLLLDEAGQATPQSACGAIWRAQRSIIIGDTLQVPPVVTMSEVLDNVLQNYYEIESVDWSPLYSSAQYLADRVTPYGTHIKVNTREMWTGIPLRAHRRCANPMFSIANKIAYNNQMVKVTNDGKNDICLGESAWINVKGTKVQGHFIEEEFEVLKKMIDALMVASDHRSVFIISPFRSVLTKAYIEFKEIKNVSCGTIHTFQGKEADIVFVMLGSDPARPGARQWVAQAPNMMNVAITRAKKYLYIIGNKDLWSQCSFFNDILATLPIKQVKT